MNRRGFTVARDCNDHIKRCMINAGVGRKASVDEVSDALMATTNEDDLVCHPHIWADVAF